MSHAVTCLRVWLMGCVIVCCPDQRGAAADAAQAADAVVQRDHDGGGARPDQALPAAAGAAGRRRGRRRSEAARAGGGQIQGTALCGRQGGNAARPLLQVLQVGGTLSMLPCSRLRLTVCCCFNHLRCSSKLQLLVYVELLMSSFPFFSGS